MPCLHTRVDLDHLAMGYQERTAALTRRIVICAGTGCVANGALRLHTALVEAATRAGISVVCTLQHDSDDIPVGTRLSKSGCQGFCQMGPLLSIEPEGILYCKVRPEDVDEIVERTLSRGELIERLLYQRPGGGTRCRGRAEIPFYNRQTRRVLEPCGQLDPHDIHEYIATGGYAAARQAYATEPAMICREMEASGLRGRGGGGFPTGRKWALTLAQNSTRKFVICNADEGDPGAFMDRSVMEGNPHAVIEGMMIAARAIGAGEGFVYVRLEYPLAVERIRAAVKAASDLGLLGPNCFESGQGFTIHVMEGAGAFVCGEETALMASIEGQRGMPRVKPPFPAQSGLWGYPTLINNVETLAMVPDIMRDGATAFRRHGTEKSPGTKTFALTGHIANTGLIEVPFGTTLREIIFEIGGGVTDANGRIDPNGFKAVQIGGPSGGCLTADHLDLSIDFDSLRDVGAMVGSGGMVVMNQSTCMVAVARFFMQFTQNESCGKCVLCREGTQQMLALLDTIIAGTGSSETLALLEELAHTVAKGSLCGLGKTAPSPVLSTLQLFRDEYDAHVYQQRCPAGACTALLRPHVLTELCKGCTACIRTCPVQAISGERKQPHIIDDAACIRCGSCIPACRFNAIVT